MVRVTADEGILHASGNGVPPVTKDYCIIYNSNWVSLPKSLDNATFRTLENLTSTVLCNSSEVPSGLMKDKAVVVMRGNCTFLEKARIAQTSGAKMLLIASKPRLSPLSDNKTDFEDVTIPVALIRYNDIVDMQLTLGNEVNVTLYSPPLPEFDYSMVVIFLIAVFTVALGGYWSGVAELLCHWYGADFRCFGVNEDGTTCPSLSCTVYTHHQLPCRLEAQRDEEVLERKQLPDRLPDYINFCTVQAWEYKEIQQAVPVKQCAVSPAKLITKSLTLKQFDVNLYSFAGSTGKKTWKIPHLKHVLLKQ
ncbi:signal peptide peptidasehypothetical protein [Limosa lapponica baueri]|uniref:PA domain-containing protein n=1 Tax=Limosa lapponica baueri TaxID=1758121 RepID=A0A2I0TKV7_LIMLA|nr:signal peptide peptidasehypothetical protein [Limosa lapponica baueri]